MREFRRNKNAHNWNDFVADLIDSPLIENSFHANIFLRLTCDIRFCIVFHSHWQWYTHTRSNHQSFFAHFLYHIRSLFYTNVFYYYYYCYYNYKLFAFFWSFLWTLMRFKLNSVVALSEYNFLIHCKLQEFMRVTKNGKTRSLIYIAGMVS